MEAVSEDHEIEGLEYAAEDTRLDAPGCARHLQFVQRRVGEVAFTERCDRVVQTCHAVKDKAEVRLGVGSVAALHASKMHPPDALVGSSGQPEESTVFVEPSPIPG